MKKESYIKSICLAPVIVFIFVMVVMADYLTADPQPSEVVTKYKIKLDSKVLPAEIEKVDADRVRLYYDIDNLSDGKHFVVAAAGNNANEWSDWSKEFVFYRGIPTPQNIGLYCITEDPKRIPQDGFSVYHVSTQIDDIGCGENAIDGSIKTFWHTGWVGDEQVDHPHEIQLDLGRTYTICGFWHQSRQGTNLNCMILDYKFYVSENGTDWVEKAFGKFPDSQDECFVTFETCKARYVSLVALSSINGSVCTAVAEINVLGY